MGELFIGTQQLADGAQRAVVVKRLFPDADAIHHALFEREGRALAQLDSPFITRLYARGPTHLVIEYVDGPDLATILAFRRRRGRPLPLGAAMAIILGMARGLRDLHQARDEAGRALGLVHRDVNPANILTSRSGEVKLADLGVVGISADVRAKTTIAGIKGTLGYMAPEQLAGKAIDARADVFSAGLVAYEVLTGVAARPAGSVGVAELVAARSRLPAAPSTLRETIPRALDQAILAALQPAPEARPAGIGEWLTMLDRVEVQADTEALVKAIAKAAPRKATPTATELAAAVVAQPTRPDVSADAPTGVRTGVVWVGVAVGVAVVGLVVAIIVLSAEPSGVVTPGARQADASASAETVSTAFVVAPLGLRRAAIRDAVSAPRAGITLTSSSPAKTQERVKRPTPGPRTAPAAVVGSAVVRLAVAPAGHGDVYVRGAGASQLAPVTTEPLLEGGHVIRLHGGSDPFPATLRVSRRADALTATIGAPGGTYYRVDCGRGERTTPVRGLAVGPGGLRCVLSDVQGRKMAISLRRVGP